MHFQAILSTLQGLCFSKAVCYVFDGCHHHQSVFFPSRPNKPNYNLVLLDRFSKSPVTLALLPWVFLDGCVWLFCFVFKLGLVCVFLVVCFWNLHLQRGARKGREVQLSTSQACLQRLVWCLFFYNSFAWRFVFHLSLFLHFSTVLLPIWYFSKPMILYGWLFRLEREVFRPLPLSLPIAARILLSPVLRLCVSAGPSLYLYSCICLCYTLCLSVVLWLTCFLYFLDLFFNLLGSFLIPSLFSIVHAVFFSLPSVNSWSHSGTLKPVMMGDHRLKKRRSYLIENRLQKLLKIVMMGIEEADPNQCIVLWGIPYLIMLEQLFI